MLKEEEGFMHVDNFFIGAKPLKKSYRTTFLDIIQQLHIP